MAISVLITGASGLVGTRLTEILVQKGYQVSHLGRSKKSGPIPSFVWDVDQGEIDPQAIQGVDVIINLAGTGVAEKRWNAARKKEIQESRTKSCDLLFRMLQNSNHQVKTFVGASAIGYYGYGLEDSLLTEDSPHGKDYLAQVVVDWERATDQMNSIGVRVVKIRIGIVLSQKGGALAEMVGPIRWGVGSPLGTGRQMVSWIHIDDVCEIFVHTIENSWIRGPYNAVAPNPVTNKMITQAIAQQLRKPLLLPAVPGFILHLVLGEMAEIVINGAAISCDKIKDSGFKFQYELLEPALRNLFSKDK